MRWRGLKHIGANAVVNKDVVATRAVAWIETSIQCPICGLLIVATRAVAWIETAPGCQLGYPGGGSPPVRWRGLKQEGYIGASVQAGVATRAVAWIETHERIQYKFSIFYSACLLIPSGLF